MPAVEPCACGSLAVRSHMRMGRAAQPAARPYPRPPVAGACIVPIGARGMRPRDSPQNSRGSGYGIATSMLAGELVWFKMERASSGAR